MRIWLAQWLRLSGSSDSFRWTTHPWLLDLFFNCPGQLGVACPSQQQQAAVGEAAKAAAVQLARRLDEQLGQQYKTVISLRDVPGLTRAVIPLLVAHGIRAVTVGVNAGSAPPGVPLDTPFIWRDMETDTSLLALWHAGGYGGSCNDVMTGQEVVVGCRPQCVTVKDFQHVLCFSWRADNQGGRVRLPVVTGEIGDTWVYGVASDPLKYAWEGPPHTNPWFVMDFGKPGLNATGGWMNEHIEAEPHFIKAHHSCTAEGGLSLQLHYKFEGHLHTRAGAPGEIVLQLSSPSDSETLGLNLVWLDKTPTRLPETMWLRFRLVEGLSVNPDSWRLHKLGSAAINPQEVMSLFDKSVGSYL
eukprot:gene5520-5755_t